MPKAGALAYALWLLERRLRTEAELRAKLVLRKYDPEEIAGVISKLKEKKLLDDAQYARHYVQDKAEYARRGRYRLKLELRKKGVDETLIAQALDDLPAEQELDSARQLLATRARSWQKLEPIKRYQRAVTLLMRRGFSSSIINQVVKRESGRQIDDRLDTAD